MPQTTNGSAPKKRSRPAKSSAAKSKQNASVLTRPPIERMVRFHEEAKAGNFPNCATQALIMEVCEKSISEDIEFMRTRLRLPLEYDKKKHGWYYAEKVGAFPTVQVSQSEAIWLTMAQFAFESFPGIDATGRMRSAVEKLSSATLDNFNLSPDDLRRLIAFRPGRAAAMMDESVLPNVWNGLLNSLELEFLYQKPDLRAAEPRHVQPLTMVWLDGCFYLFGFDTRVKEGNGLRTFALPRIHDVRVSRRHFERPRDFDLEGELANSFGIHTGGPVAEVRLRFRGRAVPLIRERVWHRSQRTTLLEDGTLELWMRVALNPELERWVLSWGSDALVIEPVDLREKVVSHAKGLLEAERDGW